MKKIRIIMVNIVILAAIILFAFPGLGKFIYSIVVNDKESTMAYSYASQVYNIDEKDIKNKKDIKLILSELDKSKALGSGYPADRPPVTQEGSFFITDSKDNKYKIIKSICWYGEKSNICLIQDETGQSQYYEMTPELQTFFNSKFMGK